MSAFGGRVGPGPFPGAGGEFRDRFPGAGDRAPGDGQERRLGGAGGFSGSDPAPALTGFQRMVAAHQVHYFVAGGGFAGGLARGTGSDAAQITSWVESQFKAQSVGGETVYDLAAPDAAS